MVRHRGIDTKGRSVCVIIEPNIDIEEIETEIKAHDILKQCWAALGDRFVNFKISAVYKIPDDLNKFIRYNVQGKCLK